MNSEKQLKELIKKIKEDSLYKAQKDLKKFFEDTKDWHIKSQLYKELSPQKRKIYLIIGITEEEIIEKILPEIIEKDKIEILKRLYKNNNDVIYNIDFNILESQYIQTLGEEKINIISCYPEFQEKILKMNEKQYEIFNKCLNYYIENNKAKEWTEMATTLLENITEEYQELIENIEIDETDIDKLVKILQNPNYFQIKNKEDIENFEKIKQEKLDKIVETQEDTKELKEAVLQKIFGQSYKDSQRMVEIFGEDIHNIEDGDEKDFIICLSEILKLEDIKTLKEIYKSCKPIGLIDKTYMRDCIKKAYFKEYDKTLYKIEGKKLIEDNKIEENDYIEEEFKDLKVYYAGTDFSMIITSVGAVSEIGATIENYEKSWNRRKIDTQNFCASYIRNDMLGVISTLDICYGFYNLEDSSLRKAGPWDIGSRKNETKPIIDIDEYREKYYTPNTQIEQTEFYNELDISRIQNGKKKKPEYIVAFRINKQIKNYDKIIKAYNDWKGELPIVVIDVDKCLEKEKKEIDKMFLEYKTTEDNEKAQKLYNQIKKKIKTNQYTIKKQKTTSNVERYIEQVQEELEGDRAVQKDFGIRKQELEKLLSISFDSSAYGYGKGKLKKYDLAKFIIINRQKIFNLENETNQKKYQIYRESVQYISSELAQKFVKKYKEKMQPKEEIDDFFYWEPQDIEKEYNNIVNELQEFGIDSKKMLEEIKVNQKEVDIKAVEEYILNKYQIQNKEKEQTNNHPVTKEDFKQNYETLMQEERQRGRSTIENLKYQLIHLIKIREDEKNDKKNR